MKEIDFPKFRTRIADTLSKTSQKIKSWYWDHMPGQGVQHGAFQAVRIIVTIALLILSLDFRSGIGLYLEIVLAFLLGWFGFPLVVSAIRLGLRMLRNIPTLLTAVLASGLGTMLFFWSLPEETIWLLSLVIVLVEMIFGGLVVYLYRGGSRDQPRLKRILLAGVFIAGLAANIGLVVWGVSPGTDAHLLTRVPYRGSPTIDAPNPTAPGEYSILKLTYGSGENKRRPEFGAEADLITKTVNAANFVQVSGDWKKFTRKWYWGFEPSALPLNGTVWYPDGEGPFPLVLIVHGNHDMDEYSDPGYAYLGELLASRGYIFVSVDENFLNGYFSGGLSGENDARGWLLLKHLELWEDWSNDPGTPFNNLVDMQKIALIGHSRGGEAVALAALLNDLPRYPNNGNIRLNFDFNIQTLIAIAPTDQQYKPTDQPAPLSDVNYLVLQGAHDADVSTYKGLRQWQRISFSDPQSDQFKAGVYIYQANHAQFNTVWGSRDLGLPRGFLLNTKPLLSGDEQRQIAKLYISAFLDTTLKGNSSYISLFEDYRNAGDWLPETLYINQYQNPSFKPLANFEEDVDLTTASIPGVRLNASGFNRWKEEDIEFRTGSSQNNQVVNLGWSGKNGRYELLLPPTIISEMNIDEKAFLVFSAADIRSDDFEASINFSIKLEDLQGNELVMLLGDFMPLLPPFQSQFTRLPAWELDRYENPSEAVLQSFRLPLRAFLDLDPNFQLSELIKISFLFDQDEGGRIILDDIGFSDR